MLVDESYSEMSSETKAEKASFERPCSSKKGQMDSWKHKFDLGDVVWFDVWIIGAAEQVSLRGLLGTADRVPKDPNI